MATLHRHKSIVSLEPEAPEDSELGAYLLLRWSWWKMSGPEVQNAAQLALGLVRRPNERPKDLVALSKIGHEGEYAGNCRRDLLSAVGEPETPATEMIDCPFADDSDPKKLMHRDQPVQLCSRLYWWLQEFHPEYFEQLCDPDAFSEGAGEDDPRTLYAPRPRLQSPPAAADSPGWCAVHRHPRANSSSQLVAPQLRPSHTHSQLGNLFSGYSNCEKVRSELPYAWGSYLGGYHGCGGSRF